MKYVPVTFLEGVMRHAPPDVKRLLARIISEAVDAVPVAELEKLRTRWAHLAREHSNSVDLCILDLEALLPSDPPPATLRTGELP